MSNWRTGSLDRARVRVYPDSYERHLIQLYGGLTDLQAAGAIELSVTRNLRKRPRQLARHTLWLELEHPRLDDCVGVLFDMADSQGLASRPGLEMCDLYCKRSYSDPVVAELPAPLAARVIPFGLNHECVGNRTRLPIVHLLETLVFAARGNAVHVGGGKEVVRNLVRLGRSTTPRPGSLLPAERFMVAADRPAEPRALFLTRVWEPDAASDYAEINQRRAQLVMHLRRELGERFIGGLEDTPFARRHFPDCIATVPTNRSAFLPLMHRSLVAITTTGLHGSIGWKLPEYLAASRCIVTETLPCRVPGLEAGTHYLSFSDPETCAQACRRLLDDADLASRMRAANHRYYREYVQPEAIVGRCLRHAVMRAEAAARTGHWSGQAPS
ncbi:MAG: glycosyltransferase [Deltaproteobacteria bacterium]|nr:glycosyltransferase [Deltaproteobacteria bacterium]